MELLFLIVLAVGLGIAALHAGVDSRPGPDDQPRRSI